MRRWTPAWAGVTMGRGCDIGTDFLDGTVEIASLRLR